MGYEIADIRNVLALLLCSPRRRALRGHLSQLQLEAGADFGMTDDNSHSSHTLNTTPAAICFTG